MNVAIIGDWHASATAAWAAFKYCQENGVDRILHLGDLYYTGASKHKFLASLSKAVTRYGIPFYFIRGNHDNTRPLRALEAKYPDKTFLPFHAADIYYIPDGKTWQWEGVKFAALGGAFSVDHKFRIPEKEWWADEVTDVDAAHRLVQEHPHDVDILVTHDVPASVSIDDFQGRTPPSDWDIAGSYPNAILLRDAVDVLTPQYVFSAHMHTYQRKTINLPDGNTTESIILDRGDYIGREDLQRTLQRSIAILDVSDGIAKVVNH